MSWLPALRPDARLRLFCLPYAGGGVAEFARWRLALPLHVDVVPLRLPGRDGRFAETPYDDYDALADAIARALAPAIDRPYALFGHSMGAALAFGVAARLHGWGRPLPVHLFLGARGGPDRPAEDDFTWLPDDAFLARLQARYGGIPAAVLADRELLALYLPALRADLRVALNADLRDLPRLPVPASVFVGTDDPNATPADAARWAPYVGEPFAVRVLDGGHFFLRGPNAALLAEIARGLG